MASQVRMMTPPLPASQNRIASLTANRITPEKVPDSFPYPLATLRTSDLKTPNINRLRTTPTRQEQSTPREGGVR